MRAVSLIAGVLVAFLLGAFVEHSFDWPFGYLDGPWFASAPAAKAPETGNTAVPHYSNVRGLEDAPRADTPQGAKTDLQRCINTMILRREPEAEARTVCQKIITGIGG